MSILACERCSNPIDTDFDVDAFVEELDQWRCSKCRDQLDLERAEINSEVWGG